MQAGGVLFEHGLSDVEVRDVEERFGFRFRPDLKALLQAALPVKLTSQWPVSEFPNWRAVDESGIPPQLSWPFEGIAFDIEHNIFWMESWGTKPSSLDQAIEIA